MVLTDEEGTGIEYEMDDLLDDIEPPEGPDAKAIARRALLVKVQTAFETFFELEDELTSHEGQELYGDEDGNLAVEVTTIVDALGALEEELNDANVEDLVTISTGGQDAESTVD